MRTHRLLLVVGLLALLVLAGCTVEYHTSFQEDGSGQMAMAIGYTAQEASDLAELSGGDTANLCQELWAESSSDLPPNATIREEQRGDETYCLVEFSFANLDELRSIYEEQDVTVDRLEIVDDRFYYDVSVDMTGTEGLGFAMNMTWVVTMPGSMGENNASEVNGRTLTWNLAMGQVNTLQAESSLGNSNWVWWVAGGLGCLCLLVLVIAAIAGLALYLRKKKSQ
jgi:hypothetical protein